LDNAKNGTKKKKRAPDELDKIIDNLKVMAVSYGFSEPGNLRSKNKREIKMTIKCFSEMLQQREKDVLFRKSVNERFRKLELELNSEILKNESLVDKKTKLDREVKNSKNMMTTAQDKIKDETSKTKQEAANIKKLLNDFKLKNEMMEKELKRKDRYVEKLNEQMRNVIDKRVGLGRNVDDEYRDYSNSIELIHRLKENEIEEDEDKYTHEQDLLFENDMLRACVLMIQAELNNYMAEAISRIRDLDADTKILNHLAFDKFKMTKLPAMRLEMPHSISGEKVKKICIENVQRFKDFLDEYLKPTDVYEILATVNDPLNHQTQVLNFDDLQTVIHQWSQLRMK